MKKNKRFIYLLIIILFLLISFPSHVSADYDYDHDQHSIGRHWNYLMLNGGFSYRYRFDPDNALQINFGFVDPFYSNIVSLNTGFKYQKTIAEFSRSRLIFNPGIHYFNNFINESAIIGQLNIGVEFDMRRYDPLSFIIAGGFMGGIEFRDNHFAILPDVNFTVYYNF